MKKQKDSCPNKSCRIHVHEYVCGIQGAWRITPLHFTFRYPNPLIHSLTHSLTHSYTHSLTHTLTHPHPSPFPHPLTHSLTHLSRVTIYEVCVEQIVFVHLRKVQLHRYYSTSGYEFALVAWVKIISSS